MNYWKLTFYTEEREMSMLMGRKPWIEAHDTLLALAARLEAFEGYTRIQTTEDYTLLVKGEEAEQWFVIRLDKINVAPSPVAPMGQVRSFIVGLEAEKPTHRVNPVLVGFGRRAAV